VGAGDGDVHGDSVQMQREATPVLPLFLGAADLGAAGRDRVALASSGAYVAARTVNTMLPLVAGSTAKVRPMEEGLRVLAGDAQVRGRLLAVPAGGERVSSWPSASDAASETSARASSSSDWGKSTPTGRR